MALKRINTMKDIIYIKDLRVETIIGIFDWERKVKQEVSIDMEFPFDCKKAAKTDSIEEYCGDNAAMIAFVGSMMSPPKEQDIRSKVRARWPLNELTQ